MCVYQPPASGSHCAEQFVSGGLSLVYVRCDEVIVERKHRREPPDTGALSRQRSVTSLLQPIAITPDYRLITGARRLAAAIRAGEEYIAAIVVHTLSGHNELLL